MPLNHVQSSSDHENATVAGLVIPVPGCGMVHGSDQACVWDAGQWRRVRCADRSGSARAPGLIWEATNSKPSVKAMHTPDQCATK
jgi:hypothetical protein